MINDASITGIKTGLMGPLAGIGDSIIWAAVMPLLLAIFIPFAAIGCALGGFCALLSSPAITLSILYVQVARGQSLGGGGLIGCVAGRLSTGRT
ncbi:PTS fructose transporter subunit IID [Escherichia coli]|nr:PTS fructose transporter subunit IID [Escherichia coli]